MRRCPCLRTSDFGRSPKHLLPDALFSVAVAWLVTGRGGDDLKAGAGVRATSMFGIRQDLSSPRESPE